MLENIKKKENIKITTKEETIKKLEAEEIKEVEKKVLTSEEWEKEFNKRVEEIIEKTGNKDSDILQMTVRVAMNRLYIKSEK